MSADVCEALRAFIERKKLHFEGERGVRDLCQVARALGYRDPLYFGQLGRGAFIGDLLEFLLDNSGAQEAILNWIEEQHIPEWEKSLKEAE